MQKKHLSGFIVGFFILFMAVNSYATSVTSAVGVTMNTFGVYGSDYGIENVSNQSGLSAGFTSGVTDWDTYFGAPIHSLAATGEWWGAENTEKTGTVIFDLGGIYTIDKLALWNEDAAGISSFDIYTSLDGVSFTSVGTSLTPTNHVWSTDYLADIFSLTSSVGQYVMLDITALEDYVSMGEIAFSTEAASVPEPATMLLLGLGLIGLAGVRKKINK